MLSPSYTYEFNLFESKRKITFISIRLNIIRFDLTF